MRDCRVFSRVSKRSIGASSNARPLDEQEVQEQDMWVHYPLVHVLMFADCRLLSYLYISSVGVFYTGDRIFYS